MGHGKETPRQKMIGMMYLVLTALLALNVSKDVLDAFVIVDEGLSVTIDNFGKKIQSTYHEFDEKVLQNEQKVRPWKDKSDEVRKRSDELYDYIQELKREIVVTSEGEESPALGEHGEILASFINGKDNTDVPAQIMVGDNEDGKGVDLEHKLDEYREFLLSLIPEDNHSLRESLTNNLNTDPPGAGHGDEHGDGGHGSGSAGGGHANASWISHNFEHLPLVAVVTIMTKLQADVRNAEADVTRFLLNQIDAGSFTFNKLEPTIIPNSNYIIQGNQYEAQVFLAAYDTTQAPIIYVGNYNTVTNADGAEDYEMTGRYDSLEVVNGKGIYKAMGSNVGMRKWGGLIKLRAPDGSFIKKPFEAEYQVAMPNLVVSPTAMNVFYVGIPNPVSISAAGVPDDKIFPEIRNGSITKSPDGIGYIVEPLRPGMSLVTVEAEINGQRKSMGTVEFRVKRVPNPVATVAGKKSGPISKAVLLAQAGVIAEMENFEFDLRFNVTEFTVSATVRGFVRNFKTQGNRFTDEQKALFESMGTGETIYIVDIKAIGPDKVPRDLSPMNLVIN